MSWSADKYADPDCHRCGGTGKIRGLGRSLTQCACTVVAKHQESAGRMLDALLPARARAMTLESFETGGLDLNQRALDLASNYVDSWLKISATGSVVGFYGQPRAGKTHLAVAVAQGIALRYPGVRPQLLNLPKALRAERERYDRDEVPSQFQEGETAPLLILDDLGAEYDRMGDDQQRVTWLTELLYTLLDARLMSNLPTIYTSNLTPSDLERRSSNEAWRRVYARLTESQVAALEIFPVPGLQIADPEAETLLFSPRIGPEKSDQELVIAQAMETAGIRA